MTKDQAAKFYITFGKYQGKTLGWVWTEDPAYLKWCYENLSPVFCKEFMEACEAFGIWEDE